MEAREKLVTGGTGNLGRRVVERLRARGHEARVMSRSGRPGTVRGDLLTGEGLGAAVRGVDTIIHCASNTTTDNLPSPRKTRQADVRGTGLLLEAAAGAGVRHVVFISIVGVDRNPYFFYYRAKVDAEGIVERSPVPWTILRATQFHDFVLGMIRPLVVFPGVTPVPRGLLFQPVDVGEVADRLVDLALSGPAGRAPDFGGPEIRTLADFAGDYLRATGRHKRIVEVPIPGRMARALRDGAQVTPETPRGRVSWEEFLREKFSPESGFRGAEA
jgi:uncharacterized protein YbjT (DUF2867 family)